MVRDVFDIARDARDAVFPLCSVALWTSVNLLKTLESVSRRLMETRTWCRRPVTPSLKIQCDGSSVTLVFFVSDEGQRESVR